MIGACLSVTEMRKLCRVSIFQIIGMYDDYQLHTQFMQISGLDDSRGKALQKYFDQKYSLSLKRYCRVVDEAEIYALWEEDWQEGRIDQAWFGILSNVYASFSLVNSIYRKLHMLGHENLNSRFIQQKEITAVQAKLDDCEALLFRERQDHLQEKLRLQAMFTEKEMDWHLLEQLKNELRKAKAELDQLKSPDWQVSGKVNREDELASLRQQVKNLSKTVEVQRNDLEENQQQLQLAVNELKSVDKRAPGLLERLAMQDEELKAAEALLTENFRDSPCSTCADSNTAGCPGKNLCGKVVLYVGGVNSMIPHYRQLVETYGGQFIHHDGGKEVSPALLPKMLTSADVVICPINCISHSACTCVKKMCKRFQKPFVMTRSAGLSSLARELNGIAQ